MRVTCLGSGSSGNAVLVQTGQSAILIDAGFSRRALVSRMRQAGVTPESLSAILITHEHSDHACGAAAMACQYHIPLVADPRTIRAVLDMPGVTVDQKQIDRHDLPVGQSTRIADMTVRSFPISHDAVAPCGFLLSTSAWSVFVATDTGEVREPMVEAMREASLLVIEANHDVDRLRNGPYPLHLKRRILGPTGHLSNAQAAQALLASLDDGPRWVWLAHLSRTNNTPDLAQTQVSAHLRANGLAHVSLHVAPPAVGPVWDTAALWGAPQQARLFPSDQPVPAATTVRARAFDRADSDVPDSDG